MAEFTAFVAGNLTTAPKLHTGNGKARVTFTVAVNAPRRFDQNRQQWISDGGAVFQKVIAFGQLAHNVATTVRSGQAVLVHGRLQDNSYTAVRGGEEFVVHDTELVAAHIGPDLVGATAVVTKNPRPDRATASV